MPRCLACTGGRTVVRYPTSPYAPLSQQDGGKMRAKPVGFSRARFRLGHKPHRLSITALGARASPSGLWNVLRVSWVLTEDGRRLGVDQVMAQLAALAMLTALRM